MIYIVIGAVGFLIIHCFDLISLKRVPKAKLDIWILDCGLLIYSLTMICFAPSKLLLPMWSTRLGWALLSISLPLLIYSLFINLPFRKTYVTTGVGDKLITTGLYALVRHPVGSLLHSSPAIPGPGFKVKPTTYRLTDVDFAVYPAGSSSRHISLWQDV